MHLLFIVIPFVLEEITLYLFSNEGCNYECCTTSDLVILDEIDPIIDSDSSFTR